MINLVMAIVEESTSKVPAMFWLSYIQNFLRWKNVLDSLCLDYKQEEN